MTKEDVCCLICGKVINDQIAQVDFKFVSSITFHTQYRDEVELYRGKAILCSKHINDFRRISMLFKEVLITGRSLDDLQTALDDFNGAKDTKITDDTDIGVEKYSDDGEPNPDDMMKEFKNGV